MLAALLTSAWLLGPPVQRPRDVPPIAWEAPAECPSVEDVVASVHALAPGVLSDPSPARVFASVRVVEARYEVELRLHDGEDEFRRAFVGDSCEEVAEAIALVVAVLLDPVVSASNVQTRTTADVPPTPVIEAVPLEPPTPAAEDPIEDPAPSIESPRRPMPVRRARVRAGLKLVGGGGYGPTNAGFGELGATAAVFSERWRVELGGTWTPRRVLRSDDEIGGRIDGWRVAARGCFVPRVGARDRLELPLCPGFELGQVRGRGLDELPVTLTASFPWIAVALGQGLWFAPIERLAIGVGLQLAVPLRGGRFLIETVEVQRIAPVSVRGIVGIEVRLP
jgi:hypothetical protein